MCFAAFRVLLLQCIYCLREFYLRYLIQVMFYCRNSVLNTCACDWFSGVG